MTRSEHLKSIARIAERKALKAASVLREQRRRLAQECSRQTQLSSYQDEYQRRHTEVLSQGQNAGAFKNAQRFMTQLQAASDSAQDRVTEARAACERHHQAWLNARSRSRAIEQAAERHVERDRRERDRREQTDMEDRTAAWGRTKLSL